MGASQSNSQPRQQAPPQQNNAQRAFLAATGQVCLTATRHHHPPPALDPVLAPERLHLMRGNVAYPLDASHVEHQAALGHTEVADFLKSMEDPRVRAQLRLTRQNS